MKQYLDSFLKQYPAYSDIMKGGLKMEEKKINQPSIGTWNNLPKEEVERKPKIDFQVNIPMEVIFLDDEPREYQGDNGAYYVFNIEYNKERRVILTSAWGILKGLKVITPLKGKKVLITKKMDKGKQFFEVKEVK